MNVTVVPIKTGISTAFLLQGDSTVLVDAGDPGRVGHINRQLDDLKVDPNSISLIIITHTHWDHFGSLADLVSITGAKVLIHSAERERLATGATVVPPGISRWGRFLARTLIGAVAPPALNKVKADLVFEGDEWPLVDYGIRGRILHTPGHTPGSISVILDQGDAIVGDMAMNGAPLRLTPGMPIFAECPEQLEGSWDRIISAGVKTIYPSHGRRFPLAKLRRDLPTAK